MAARRVSSRAIDKWSGVFAVVAAPLFCLLPFVTKAFHVDDPVYIWIARRIVENPLDFYGFHINWYGYDQPVYEMHNSPPLASFYLALFGLMFGWSELAMHLAMLPPAIALGGGTYWLARRTGAPPVLSSLVCLSMPVVLVSATSIMLDIMMTAFFVLAVACWIHGSERASPRWLIAGALVAGLAAFTKYFGLALVPLLAAYTLLRRKHAMLSLAILGVPLLMLAGVEFYGYTRYGRFIIGNAAAFATQVRSLADTNPLDKSLIGLCFAGGSVFSVLFFLPLRRDRHAFVAALIAFFAAAVVVLARGRLGVFQTGGAGDTRWGFIIQAAAFCSAAVGLAHVALSETRRNPTPVNITLLLWIGGTFVYATFVNWGINARSFLPLAPPAALLITRGLNTRANPNRPPAFAVSRLAPLAPAFALAIMLAHSDFVWANSIRSAARTYASLIASRGVNAHFQGHWGFQYYMQEAGIPCVDFDAADFKTGDIVIAPLSLPNVFPLPEGAYSAKYEDEFPGPAWLATMSGPLGAGFYSDGLGPLPFAFGRVRPDRYVVYVIRNPGNPFRPMAPPAT